MALESRSRMVSFRLTDEEYERFRGLCLSRGLRNVSELIRGAVNQLIVETGEDFPGMHTQPEIQERVANLEIRLAELASVVGQLERHLRADTLTNREHLKFVQTANYKA